MNNNVEEIKSRLNIVDVVGEYVRLTKGGANWKGLCPFHHEKSPSFMVNEEKQIFHCFGCAKGGDVFTFVQEIESLEFKEVLKLLAEKAGVQLEEFKSQESGNKKRVLEALELATKFYETQLWKGMGKEKILNYLHERGLKDESIQTFRLGYAPGGWDNMIKFLVGRGFSMDEIEKTGLLVKKENNAGYYDRFRDRIMFPIQDILGNVVGYSARVAPGGDESQAKYINTPETLVYHKSKALYGIFNAKNEIKQKNYVLLVEGNMDVIASHQAGIRNTVAVSGTALTSDQVVMLKRYTENISMLFDMDSAGQKAGERSADLCFQNGVNARIVVLTDGKDAAEVVQKDPKILLDAVEKSTMAMEYFFNLALKRNDRNSAEGKQKIAQEVLAHVAYVSSDIEKAHWVKKMAEQLGVEENVISGVLKKSASDNGLRHEKAEPIIKQESSSFRTRSDVVRDSLAGLVVSYPEVWKNAVTENADADWVKNDSFLRFLFEKGPQVNFSFDGLVADIDDDRVVEKLKKIYFEAKYRFQRDEVIEYSQDDMRQMIDEHIAQYAKELQKEKLHAIIREIKGAEQAGNKEALTKLMSEFTKLSQEMQ